MDPNRFRRGYRPAVPSSRSVPVAPQAESARLPQKQLWRWQVGSSCSTALYRPFVWSMGRRRSSCPNRRDSRTGQKSNLARKSSWWLFFYESSQLTFEGINVLDGRFGTTRPRRIRHLLTGQSNRLPYSDFVMDVTIIKPRRRRPSNVKCKRWRRPTGKSSTNMTVMMVLCNGSRNESVAQFLLNATKLEFVARVPENDHG